MKILKAVGILLAGTLLVVPLIIGVGTSIVIPLQSAKNDVEFRQLIGTRYRLNEDFKVFGMTNDMDNKSLAYQYIFPARINSHKNRYVIYQRSLAKGTILELTDVLVSEWPTFAPLTKYVLSNGDEQFEIEENWFKEGCLSPVPGNNG